MDENECNPILTVGQIRAENGLAMFVEGVLVQHAGRIMQGLRATGMVDAGTTQRVLLKVSTRLFDIGRGPERVEVGVEELGRGPVQTPAPEAARRLGPGKKAKARKGRTKRAPKAEDAGEVRTCPVCGVPISRLAVGCVKHWREVKRGLEPGWQDARKGK